MYWLQVDAGSGAQWVGHTICGLEPHEPGLAIADSVDLDTVRAALRAIDPSVPLSDINSMDSLFDDSLAPAAISNWTRWRRLPASRWRWPQSACSA